MRRISPPTWPLRQPFPTRKERERVAPSPATYPRQATMHLRWDVPSVRPTGQPWRTLLPCARSHPDQYRWQRPMRAKREVGRAYYGINAKGSSASRRSTAAANSLLSWFRPLNASASLAVSGPKTLAFEFGPSRLGRAIASMGVIGTDASQPSLTGERTGSEAAAKRASPSLLTADTAERNNGP